MMPTPKPSPVNGQSKKTPSLIPTPSAKSERQIKRGPIGTHAKSNAHGQCAYLQREIVQAVWKQKATGNTLAQLCRSWSMLEEQRQRLKGLRTRRAAEQAPSAASSFASSHPGAMPSVNDEQMFMESIPKQIADSIPEGLTIATRQPPENPNATPKPKRPPGRPRKSLTAEPKSPPNTPQTFEVEVEPTESPTQETNDQKGIS